MTRLAAIVALLMAACGTSGSGEPPTRVVPLIEADSSADRLLRPRGLALDEETLAIAEEGRRTLTLVREGVVESRRPLWPVDLPAEFVSAASDDAGTVVARASDGYWVAMPGLGPLFLPDRGPSFVLGAGVNGDLPADGGLVSEADLTAIRGLALDEDELLVAVADQILRVVDDRFEAVAGSGESGIALDGVATEMTLALGAQVGLTVAGDGAVLFADAGSGRLWRVAGGQARAVAGGGERFLAPADPVDSDTLALQLGHDHLSWRAGDDALIALLGGTVYRLTDLASAAPQIQVLAGSAPLARGLALRGDAALITSLFGSVFELTDAGSEPILAPEAVSLPLGRAGAVLRIGSTSLVIQDPAQGRVSLWVPGQGAFAIDQVRTPAAPMPWPIASTPDANVFAVSTRGLQYTDLSGPVSSLLARRSPLPVADGQRIDETILPMVGELRGDGEGRVWLLDVCQGLLLRFEPGDGLVEHVAGQVNGGGRPGPTADVRLDLLTLEAPTALTVTGDLALVVDTIDGRDALYALNSGDDAVELTGVAVEAGRGAYLGGNGAAAYSEGEPLFGLALQRIHRVTSLGDALVLSVDDIEAPAVVLVDREGLVSTLSEPTAGAPDALAATAEGLVLLGWESAPELVAINPGETSASLLGVEVPARDAAQLTNVAAGIRDIIALDAGAVLTVSADGEIERHSEEGSAFVGRTSSDSASAAAVDGAVYLLDAGALFAVAFDGAPTLMEESVPTSPGALVLDALEGWRPNTRLSTLPFGANVTSMTVASDGSLYWTDGDTQSLLRARPESGEITGETIVDLVSRGEPVPLGHQPLSLSVAAEVVYLAGWTSGDANVSRFAGDAWASFGPRFTGTTGMVAERDGVFVRHNSGVTELDLEGEVVGSIPDLASQVRDPTLAAFTSAMTVIRGRPVVILGGGVYQLTDDESE